MWNCLWGNAIKRSPGIIRKSKISYPGPGILSSATWPSLPKKHYNGLNQTKLFKFDWKQILCKISVCWGHGYDYLTINAVCVLIDLWLLCIHILIIFFTNPSLYELRTVGLHCQTPTQTHCVPCRGQFVPFLWWSLVWPGREANSRLTVWEADMLTTKPNRHGDFACNIDHPLPLTLWTSSKLSTRYCIKK